MKLRRLLLFLVFASLYSMSQQRWEPLLKRADLPQFPRLALGAHIEGTVKVSFLLDENGKPTNIEASSENALLKDVAVSNVKTWELERLHDLYRTTWNYDRTFVKRVISDITCCARRRKPLQQRR